MRDLSGSHEYIPTSVRARRSRFRIGAYLLVYDVLGVCIFRDHTIRSWNFPKVVAKSMMARPPVHVTTCIEDSLKCFMLVPVLREGVKLT